MIRNTTIAENAGLPTISAIIDARLAVLFGHVARFDDRVATRCTLRLAIDIRSGTPERTIYYLSPFDSFLGYFN